MLRFAFSSYVAIRFWVRWKTLMCSLVVKKIVIWFSFVRLHPGERSKEGPRGVGWQLEEEKFFFPVCSEGKFHFDVFFFCLTLQYVEGECDCTIEENSHFFCLHHQKSSCTWLRRSLLREFFRRCPLVPFIRNVVTLTTASDSVIASDTRRRHKLFTRAIFLSFLLYQKKKRRQNNLKSSLSRNLIHVWSVHATISSIYLPMKINTPPNIQSWLSPSNELIDVFFSLL